MAKEFIYFAHMNRARLGNVYKVGYSTNPSNRVYALGCKELPCTLLLSVEGRLQDEQAIHTLLAPYAVENEWYRPNRRLHRLMSFCAEKGALPESVTKSGDAWLARRLAIRAFRASQTEMGADISNHIMPDLPDPWRKGLQGPANDDLSWLPSAPRQRLEAVIRKTGVNR